MPGVQRACNEVTYGGNFPGSQYHDPRGGRPSALEMNILRYRACEATLYLFYTEDLKRFMLENIYPMIPDADHMQASKTAEEKRLADVIWSLAFEARQANKISAEDAEAIRQIASRDPDEGKKLRRAFSYAVHLGISTQQESEDVQNLIKYRNDLAHRLHKITADISRHSLAVDYAAIVKSGYQADALDKLRSLRAKIVRSTKICSYQVNMSIYVFEFAERFYEAELKRLDSVIRKQAKVESERREKIYAELEQARSVFRGELDPRHPRNFKRPTQVGREEFRYSNKLTPRGVEICFQLFEAGFRTIVVAYLMGLTMRSVERRFLCWQASVSIQRNDIKE
ncbi:hypothetical protein [Pseudomonas shirazensis]|uniref:hypothetical protein n=1 Tax=Pseudomonas shirazensis TaxID=2745494 RepID=UPI003D2A3DBF